jgi:hypothetical protein
MEPTLARQDHVCLGHLLEDDLFYSRLLLSFDIERREDSNYSNVRDALLLQDLAFLADLRLVKRHDLSGVDCHSSAISCAHLPGTLY